MCLAQVFVTHLFMMTFLMRQKRMVFDMNPWIPLGIVPVHLTFLLYILLSFCLSGKNCELCRSGFFWLEESDPTSGDLCQPCNCNTAGTVNSSKECSEVHPTQTADWWWRVGLTFQLCDFKVFRLVENRFVFACPSSLLYFWRAGRRSVSL